MNERYLDEYDRWCVKNPETNELIPLHYTIESDKGARFLSPAERESAWGENTEAPLTSTSYFSPEYIARQQRDFHQNTIAPLALEARKSLQGGE